MPSPAPLPAPLSPAMHHILLALLEGDLHGYAIMQAVEALSDGAMRLGPGTLYGTIKRLLELHLVEETDERPVADDDERRRYYRLTTAGREAVRAETSRLSRLVRFATRHARGALEVPA
ncbi:MAG: helix-turn-helix transcriptional regulator [Proteobacteria bacterium]|nr:helix-turn-helix transcriptional regulator [Pseudomonadota bacterium]